MSGDILNFRASSHAIKHKLKKRDSLFNFGGSDKSQVITGQHNQIGVRPENSASDGQETLLRKTAHQIGRIFEGGTDLATAPVQWLNHMQQNWLTYLVCATVLLIGALILYFCIRQKISALSLSQIDALKRRNMTTHEDRKSRIDYTNHVLEL